MTTVLVRNWWALAIRGVLAILLGIIALVNPAGAVAVFVLLFGVYAIIEGILSIVAGVRAAERHEKFWPMLLKGIVDILAGVVAFIAPAAAAFALVLVVAFWAIVTGVLELVAAFRLRREHGEWLLILNGLLSLVLGAVLLFRPAAGLLVLLWWLGAYAIVFGIVLLMLAFRLRARHHRMPPPSARPA